MSRHHIAYVIPAALPLLACVAIAICALSGCDGKVSDGIYTAPGGSYQVQYPRDWDLISDTARIGRYMRESGLRSDPIPAAVFYADERAGGLVLSLPNSESFTLQQFMHIMDANAPGQDVQVREAKDSIVAGLPLSIRVYQYANGAYMLAAFAMARDTIYQYSFYCMHDAYTVERPEILRCLASMRLDPKHFTAGPSAALRNETATPERLGLHVKQGFGNGFIDGLLLPYSIIRDIIDDYKALREMGVFGALLYMFICRYQHAGSYMFGSFFGLIAFFVIVRVLVGLAKLLKGAQRNRTAPRTD